jgi:hypothetical protein
MSTEGEAHDPERVVELRRASLERAGYDPASARELAGRKAGFPPDVARGLLTSGDRPVF